MIEFPKEPLGVLSLICEELNIVLTAINTICPAQTMNYFKGQPAGLDTVACAPQAAHVTEEA